MHSADERTIRVCPVLTAWRLTQGHLEGVVSGNPDYTDGTVIETGSVLAVHGTRVRTQNGEYALGALHPSYAKLLACMRMTPATALYVVAVHNSLPVRAARAH